MSTHTEHPPVQPAPPESPHDDEFRGAFGFFRKHQKLILYTAGIFALVTFSITGAVTQFFSDLTRPDTGPRPQLTVMGRKVELSTEDVTYGGLLARYAPALPQVMPDIGAGDGRSDLPTRYAILRRASIEAGLDVSMDEVDRAIDWYTRATNEAYKTNDTPSQIARRRGMDSLAQYRDLVKEAMRIGNFLMLDSAGIDTSAAAVMQNLLRDREKITLEVATFDMKQLEQELRDKGDVTEADIKAWLEGKSEAEKNRLQVYDTNRVGLLLGVARFDQFDPEQWTEQLEDFELGDQQRKQLYQQDRELRFKNEDDSYRQLEDESVTEELTRIAQVEHVLRGILDELRTELGAALKTAQEELTTATQDRAQAMQARDEAKAAAEAEPENEELQQALRLAEERLTQMQSVEESARAALDEARAAFDFRGRWQAATEGKAGFELKELPGENNAEDLKDLSAVELGTWNNPYLATVLQKAGDVGVQVARAEHGAFLLQVTDVVVRPMKPWEDLQESITEAYYIEQAKEVGAEQRDKLEEELLRLAKSRIPEELAEIEQKRQTQIDERFAAWRSELEEKRARAEEMLTKVPEGTQARAAWQQELQTVQGQLDDAEAQREAITTEVAEELDEEIKAAARERYGDVLAEAVAETRFTLETLGPYDRQLSNVPWWNKRYPRSVAFLWGGRANDLDQGEATDIIEDTEERRWQVAVCKSVEPLTVADITRREFRNRERTFALMQTLTALQQSYTLDALKQRYDYFEPEGRQVVEDEEPR